MTQENTQNGVHAYGDTPETFEIKKLSQAEFELEMSRAMSMKLCDTENSNYWLGYIRGLRRAFHGERFGTSEEHEKHLSLIGDNDDMKNARGRGYRAGLRGVPDSEMFTCIGD